MERTLHKESGFPMCDHTKVVFIGYQERLEGDPIPLFNCQECHTTITLKRHEALQLNFRSGLHPQSLGKRVLMYN
ncbi:hypothetical protein ACFL6I_07625 [candidate division KSB1 bacterium]